MAEKEASSLSLYKLVVSYNIYLESYILAIMTNESWVLIKDLFWDLKIRLKIHWAQQIICVSLIKTLIDCELAILRFSDSFEQK